MANGTVQTNIDFQAADKWQKEVANELAEVDILLKEVAKACQEMPGEKDPLINMIEETGNGLATAWQKLTSGFGTACKAVSDGLNKLGEGGQEAIDKIKKFAETIAR